MESLTKEREVEEIRNLIIAQLSKNEDFFHTEEMGQKITFGFTGEDEVTKLIILTIEVE